MKANYNRRRLTAMLAGIQKSIDMFATQGITNVHFTAQFLKNGKKQNGILRGDPNNFQAQIRTYVQSEEADTVKVEFVDELSGKTIYNKVLTELQLASSAKSESRQEESQSAETGLGGYNGLGEAQVNALVDKRVEARERETDYLRTKKELEELQRKYEQLEGEYDEVEETLKAKKETEYYMGIIGAAFPGLAPLFAGTPLAQAANFLAGTSDLNGAALPAATESTNPEADSLVGMMSEFCRRLSTQQISAIHLLFMAFEKDEANIQRALQTITTTPLPFN
jgi:hypothetical protein